MNKMKNDITYYFTVLNMYYEGSGSVVIEGVGPELFQ